MVLNNVIGFLQIHSFKHCLLTKRRQVSAVSNIVISAIGKNDAAVLNLVGQRMRAIRKRLNWTQMDLALSMQPILSSAVISRYERGKADMQLTTYLSLVKTLGVTPNDLAGWTDSGSVPSNELSEYNLLSESNRKMIDRLIHALLLEQSLP